jgi:hypothetical protein
MPLFLFLLCCISSLGKGLSTERQLFYIRQVVCKPQRATVQQHILQMGVLNDYVRYLLMLMDSLKAVPTTKKGNIPFGKADLAAIVLVSVPKTWQNQYSPTHLTVSKWTRALQPDLEVNERVMVEKQNEKLVIPRGKCLGTWVIKSLRRLAERSFASIAKPTAAPTRPTTPWTAVAMSAMVSPSWKLQVSPLSPRNTTRSLW